MGIVIVDHHHQIENLLIDDIIIIIVVMIIRLGNLIFFILECSLTRCRNAPAKSLSSSTKIYCEKSCSNATNGEPENSSFESFNLQRSGPAITSR